MEGKLKERYYLVVILLTSLCNFAFSLENYTSGRFFPDNYEIRREYKNIIYGTNTEVEKQTVSVEECLLTGKKVKFSIVKKESDYYFIFINEDSGKFPLVSSGTYIVKRNIDSAEIVQIKIFIKNSQDTYIRISGENGKTLLDIYLYGTLVYQGIVLPVTMDEVITSPFERIVELSEYIVDWSLFDSAFDASENLKLSGIGEKITEKLVYLRDSDDGAQDNKGNFIFIESLSPQLSEGGFNCSGFVKWICDGLYYASERKLMDVETLKSKNIDKRATLLNSILEDERDPFFGLDWTRNIAMELHELKSEVKADIGAVDVRNYPFDDYIFDRGYRVASLKSVLYYLAKKEPGYFYLGSVNGDFGEGPVLRQHFHVAAFFPVFSEDGDFIPSVFERNRKTDIDDFSSTYSNNYIHLVRIKADNAYILPDIDNN